MRVDSISVPVTVLLVAGAAAFLPNGLASTPPSSPAESTAQVERAYTSYLPETPLSAAERATISTAPDSTGAAPTGEGFDSRSLDRSDAIAVWRTDRQGAIARLASTLRDQGFTASGLDADRGEVRGSRSVDAEGQDEVLLWIEGQAGDPGRLKVYADFGRYERAGAEAGRRVPLSASQMKERFARLRLALQSAS